MNVRGMNVVVTGKVAGESRLTAEAKLRDAGANVQSSVTATTDLLVTGDKVGASKTNKAAALGVQVMPWEQVWSNGNGPSDDEPKGGSPAGGPAPVLPSARQIAPMLAKLGELPAGEGWLYEVKWDGVRCVATVQNGAVAMQSRSAKTAYETQFPHVAAELAHMPDGVYDGELVVVGEAGSMFATMQDLSKKRASFVIFDMLEDGFEGDLRRQPLTARRQLLEDALLAASTHHGQLTWIAVSPAFDDGEQLIEMVAAQGGEGVVAKKKSSRYEEGARPDTWLKVKLRLEQDFAVIGWNPGEGGRDGEAGSLLLAVWNPEVELFEFVGRVGTGKTGSGGGLNGDFWREVTDLPRIDSPACPEAAVEVATRSKLAGVVWVEPTLVVQVRFQRWTEDGKLWHPSVVGVRHDVGTLDTRREG